MMVILFSQFTLIENTEVSFTLAPVRAFINVKFMMSELI